MKDLQEATEKICELKGSLLVLDTLLMSLVQVLPQDMRAALRQRFEAHAEIARTVLLHAPISEHTIGTFDHEASRTLAIVGHALPPLPPPAGRLA
jgi:hypothetical protein